MMLNRLDSKACMDYKVKDSLVTPLGEYGYGLWMRPLGLLVVVFHTDDNT